MGMRFIVLLVVAIVAINTASAFEHDITSETTSPNRSLVRVTTIKRSFRVEKTDAANLVDVSDDTDSEDSEERANVQGLSKLAELDKKTWKLRKLDMKLSNKIWLHGGKKPDYVLNYLRLYGNWAKIDENKRVIQWFRFVKDYQKAKGSHRFNEFDIYALSQRITNEESKLATLFQSLKQIPDLKNLAERMEHHQFNLWFNRKETPDSIVELLNIPNRPPSATEVDLRYDALMGFAKVFKTYYKFPHVHGNKLEAFS